MTVQNIAASLGLCVVLGVLSYTTLLFRQHVQTQYVIHCAQFTEYPVASARIVQYPDPCVPTRLPR